MTRLRSSTLKEARRPCEGLVEKPDAKDCFHHATCWLPGYTWEDIFGFTPADIQRYEEVIRSTAHLIL